jgi:hypothetical protein
VHRLLLGRDAGADFASAQRLYTRVRNDVPRIPPLDAKPGGERGCLVLWVRASAAWPRTKRSAGRYSGPAVPRRWRRGRSASGPFETRGWQRTSLE